MKLCIAYFTRVQAEVQGERLLGVIQLQGSAEEASHSLRSVYSPQATYTGTNSASLDSQPGYQCASKPSGGWDDAVCH